MKRLVALPISVEEATPLVKTRVAMIEEMWEEHQRQAETLPQMRDEIAVLKGEKAKPKFKSSKMDEETDKAEGVEDGREGDDSKKKRPGSAKRSKTDEWAIHEDHVIPPETPIPTGSRFNGYRDFVVQGLKKQTHTTRYRRECGRTPEGSLLVGKLPDERQGHHFDPTLRSYILYQYHHGQVTQPLLLEQLREWGIDLSAGQIDALLSADKKVFHEEKNDVLVAGLEVSQSITVDDSGARHKGKNGYVTQIGNELFAGFASTSSKSRINFIECLHAGRLSYRITEAALTYMKEQGLSVSICPWLSQEMPPEINPRENWQRSLDAWEVKDERHVRIATEGALLGGLLEKGFNLDLAIIRDGAGQFAILLHGLCWIHAERLVHKRIPMNNLQRDAIARVRDQVWNLYADLKVYKHPPDSTRMAELEARFTASFTQRTGYAALDQWLKRLHRHKHELLRVLRRPDVPLPTNGSETDIRDFVKKRKVSGGTRSDLGRQCRDTFASLKKTCRKLDVSFWQYLIDRVSLTNIIPPLPRLIRNASISGASP